MRRERERETDRWLTFEKRVLGTSESSERGFELALYFAITGSEPQGREAVKWAIAHPCERRQVALVLDWASKQMSDGERKTLLQSTCPALNAGKFEQMRDRLFWQIVRHETPPAEDVHLPDLPSGSELYALAEYLDVYHTTQAEDLRRQDVAAYMQLPATYLLSIPPHELERPTWQQHIAALALVTLDPNMQGSQFLQGWALEDRFVLQSGPGVGYEFLWADAYLPGVGYQNLEPWIYWDKLGQLWARTDWSINACWINLLPSAAKQENCTAGWQQRAMQFGRLQLIPITERCITLPESDRNQVVVVRAPANAKLSYIHEKEKYEATTDAAGLWHVVEGVQGKVCVVAGGSK
ncbi:MAG TPA: hypothetical protein VH351_15625 [Bryobacteraceae bacterium]|nr:hypothetical protein [Bryobacteraceae bacterium]